ncbi:Glycosyltransferase family 10 (fucosyltransferase) C-term [Lachnospiraceae bacterium]|nr:Glycosyltransferase family 10 (fucosyltransferase) C-term [Lachnospiraceae bacterium]
MKKIKINFKGFWDNFDPENNYFINILRKSYDVEISDEPDYLFYSIFSDEYINYDNAVRIFFTGEAQSPDFNLCDYAIGFDYIDFGDRYFRYPLYMIYGRVPETAAVRNGMIENTVIKDKFCSFVYSNSKAFSERTEIFEKLSKYKKVDSGGRYLNNVGGPVPDKRAFESGYKFSIAFENSVYSGYTSEKILEAFAAGTVPIYLGDPDISRVFNDKAFINVRNFASIDEVVEEVKRLDGDDESYLEMLSQPIFREGYDIDSKRCEFEKFLIGIFEGDKDKAFRRNRTFRGGNYELFFKRYCNINMRLRKMKDLFRKK